MARVYAEATEFSAKHPDDTAVFAFEASFGPPSARRFVRFETGLKAFRELPLKKEETTVASGRLARGPRPGPPAATFPIQVDGAAPRLGHSKPAVRDTSPAAATLSSLEGPGANVRPQAGDKRRAEGPIKLESEARPKVPFRGGGKHCIFVTQDVPCTEAPLAFGPGVCRNHFGRIPVVPVTSIRGLYELMMYASFVLEKMHSTAWTTDALTLRNATLFRGPAPWTHHERFICPSLDGLQDEAEEALSFGFVLSVCGPEATLKHRFPLAEWTCAPSVTVVADPTATWETLAEDRPFSAYGPIAVRTLKLAGPPAYELLQAEFGEAWHCDIAIDAELVQTPVHVSRLRTSPWALTLMNAQTPCGQATSTFFSYVKTARKPFASFFDGSYTCLNAADLRKRLEDDFNARDEVLRDNVQLAFFEEPAESSGHKAAELLYPTFCFCTLPSVSPHYLGTAGKDSLPKDRRTVVHMLQRSTKRIDAIALVRLVPLPALVGDPTKKRTASCDEARIAHVVQSYSHAKLGNTPTLMLLVDVLVSRPGTGGAGRKLLQMLWTAVGARFTSPSRPVVFCLSFTNTELGALYGATVIEDGKTLQPISLECAAPYMVYCRDTSAHTEGHPAELRLSTALGVAKSNPALAPRHTGLDAFIEAHDTLKASIVKALKAPETLVDTLGAACGAAAAASCALATFTPSVGAFTEQEQEATLRRTIATVRAHILFTLNSSSPRIIEETFRSSMLIERATAAFQAELPEALVRQNQKIRVEKPHGMPVLSNGL